MFECNYTALSIKNNPRIPLNNTITGPVLACYCYSKSTEIGQYVARDIGNALTGSEVRVSLRESIWILAEDFCENPLNHFFH